MMNAIHYLCYFFFSWSVPAWIIWKIEQKYLFSSFGFEFLSKSLDIESLFPMFFCKKWECLKLNILKYKFIISPKQIRDDERVSIITK